MSDKQESTQYRRVSPTTNKEDQVKTVVEINCKPVDLITTQNDIEIYQERDGRVLYGVKNNRVVIKLLVRATDINDIKNTDIHVDFVPLVGIKKEDIK